MCTLTISLRRCLKPPKRTRADGRSSYGSAMTKWSKRSRERTWLTPSAR
ncbi:MAG: hypothetical protein E6I11_04620 [Chloroflexi bacterium]|nr:MAG: hypothetical protein E6I17_11595 [Chloroflexota bacterium]TMF86405.1 MAG: hypothetical protein E6I11_04620 [Chloroflexota bacterium]TMG09595.1 MAG: hypothetical protein E6I00_14780 [Chloroflexota bacterium]